MNIRRFIFPVIIFIISLFACKKDDPFITATGELIDGGNPATDGSGFFIRLDNKEELKPDDLPDSLEIQGIRTRVEIKYQHTGNKYHVVFCGNCPGMPIIHIIDIRKI